MKKIIILLLCALLTSCAPNKKPNENQDIKLSIKEGTEVVQGPITLLFDNKTDQQVGYGRLFTLETKGGEDIDMREGIEFTADMILIEPKSISEQEIDLSFIYNELKPGDYKIVYNVTLMESNESEELTTEFTILQRNTSYVEASLLYEDDNELYLYDKGGLGLFVIEEPNNLDVTEGDVLGIEYDVVLESYPAQMTPITVKKLNHDLNLIHFGLYLIDETNDDEVEALVDGIKEVALDVKGLDESDAETLRFLLEKEFERPVMLKTMEDLEKEGKMVGEGIRYYPDGVLVGLVLEEVSDIETKFNLTYFRSGDGAIGMGGIATDGYGDFQIEYDDFWIA